MREIDSDEFHRIRKYGKKLEPADLRMGMEVHTEFIGWYTTGEVVGIDYPFVWIAYTDRKGETGRVSMKWKYNTIRDERVGFWNHYYLHGMPEFWEVGKTYKFGNHHRDSGVTFTVTALDQDHNALALAVAKDGREYLMGLAYADRYSYVEEVTDPAEDEQEQESPDTTPSSA